MMASRPSQHCAQRLCRSGLALTLFASTLLMSGCGGTETGNPSGAHSVSIALVLRSTNSQETDHAPLPYVAIDAAWLSSETLQLQACTGGGEAGLPAHVWDLSHPRARTTQTAEPSFCTITLRTQQMLQTNLPPQDASSPLVPSQLAGASLWIQARRRDGTSVEVTSQARLELMQTSGAPLADTNLTYAFDAPDWFSGLNLDIIAPDPDGIVRISPASHPALLQSLEAHIGTDSVLRPREVEDAALEDDGREDN